MEEFFPSRKAIVIILQTEDTTKTIVTDNRKEVNTMLYLISKLVSVMGGRDSWCSAEEAAIQRSYYKNRFGR